MCKAAGKIGTVDVHTAQAHAAVSGQTGDMIGTKQDINSQRIGDKEMYWRYWKRGWWSLLMQFSANLLGMLLFLPGAYLQVYLGQSPAINLAVALVVTIIVLLPILGWLFEVFARNSERLEPGRHPKSH